MRKRFVGIVLACIFALSSGGFVKAVPSPHIMMSEVQLGGAVSGTAGHEFIELYNTSLVDVTVTGWQIEYTTSTDSSARTILTLDGAIKAHDFALFVSATFPPSEGVVVDGIFSNNSGLAGDGGHVRLRDATHAEIDKLGWGSLQKPALNPETAYALAPSAGHSLARTVLDEGTMSDTDHNAVDFSEVSVPTPKGGGYFVPVIPPSELPEEPTPLPNQPTPLPLEYPIVQISELLPNPVGSDSVGEYIELYNPHDFPLNLEKYRLQFGEITAPTKELGNFVIDAHGYLALYSTDSGVTLTNTGGRVRVLPPQNSQETWSFETSSYGTASEGMAWAAIEDIWQFTNQPTAELANMPSRIEVEDDEPVQVACGEGKYRNPETNRCKSIEVDNELAACSAGQERNPDTNRCRKIASLITATLAACAPGQERNPSTNRCRKIVSESSLVPCNVGEERNPDTNRCRKVTSLTSSLTPQPIDAAATPPSPAEQLRWWTVGIAVAGATGYALYEWRHEIAGIFQKIRRKFARPQPPIE